jgi:ribose transport system ATP-binding protein
MVGRKVDQLFPARPAATGDVVLSVRGVSGAPMVKESSFEVRAGEVVGIGGLVGAGRTELLRLIYGLDKPDTGEVYMSGKRLPAGKPAAAIAAGLGLAPEDRKSQGLLLDWSLTKNVTLADLGRFRRGPLIDGRGERGAALEQLRALKTVPDDGERIVRELSGGNQQKVVLARWLLRECKVLLLDEPTRGVDVGARSEIYALIRRLADDGVAVVVVSSEVPEVLGLADRVLVISEGRIVHEGPAAAIDEHRVLDLVMEGRVA